MLQRARRPGFALIALTASLGVLGQVVFAALYPGDEFGGSWWRNGLNTFAYFTTWSNIVVALVFGALARNPNRESRWFWVFRLDSVAMITVTGAVFHLLLAKDYHYIGLRWVINHLLHTVTPILAVLGYLVLGPRRLISRGDIFRALPILFAWTAIMYLRGAITHWYPYGFLSVELHGYAGSLIAVTTVTLIGLVLFCLCAGYERLRKAS